MLKLPWFPLPSNLINKGEQWVPEIKQTATVCSAVIYEIKRR
jgi:hypothetical protein